MNLDQIKHSLDCGPLLQDLGRKKLTDDFEKKEEAGRLPESTWIFKKKTTTDVFSFTSQASNLTNWVLHALTS